ncbi:MAG: hypothetical protein IKO25_10590 [Clostridia bacterium]|nr:hypothetical protein [Clostridia bacterium]
MKSILIKDTTREERIRIVHQALWDACGIDCDDGLKEILEETREIR